MQRFFHRHQPKTTLKAAMIAGLGSALAVVVLALITQYTQFALLMAPLGASCVLVFGFHSSPFSQPANVVGGHAVAAAIGLAFHYLVPGIPLIGGAVVGISVFVMMALRIVHPPAGATGLVAYAVATSWWFIVFPVVAGSLVLVAIGTGYHAVTKTKFPILVPKPTQ